MSLMASDVQGYYFTIERDIVVVTAEISVFSILGLEHDGDEVSKLYRHADAIAMIKIHEVLDKGTREFAPEVRRSDFVPPKKQVPPPTKRKV